LRIAWIFIYTAFFIRVIRAIRGEIILLSLATRLKGDTAKMAIASRLRTETILPVTWIAKRLNLGTAKSARPRLGNWQRSEQSSTQAKD
jgi:hypothetical protein